MRETTDFCRKCGASIPHREGEGRCDECAVYETEATLRDAYEEGFYDGQDNGRLDYKYPPLSVAWLLSNTRTDLEIPMTPAQRALVKKWHDAKFDERTKMS